MLGLESGDSNIRVQSYTEWEKLEEVIVGSLDGAACVPWEAGMYAVTPVEDRDAAQRYHLANGGTPVMEASKRAAEEELREFVSILEGEGIVVRRPAVMDHSRPLVTPYWSVPGQNSHANPRDVLAVLGEEILEAPMAWRSRYFEFLAYRDLVHEYFRAGCKWTAAPKPSMANASYDWEFVVGKEYVVTEHEPMFDAADLCRCGRDVFVQRSHVTNTFGIEWLRRHFEDRFVFHPVEFGDDRAIHIDATFVPLSAGMALLNPDRPFKVVPEVLEGSRWRLLLPPASTLGERAPANVRWLSMNILSLDPETVIVEASEGPMQAFLAAEGFKVIPCPFRNNYKFGGSFHCATVDIRRRGEQRSYFE